MLTPKILVVLLTSLIKLFQYIGLNLILIKPGFATEMFSMSESLFLRTLTNWSAISKGDLLLIFDNTIDTFVEISHSKFCGGISTLIPFRLSGNSIKPLLFRSLIRLIIFSRYMSNMFIIYFYVI